MTYIITDITVDNIKNHKPSIIIRLQKSHLQYEERLSLAIDENITQATPLISTKHRTHTEYELTSTVPYGLISNGFCIPKTTKYCPLLLTQTAKLQIKKKLKELKL